MSDVDPSAAYVPDRTLEITPGVFLAEPEVASFNEGHRLLITRDGAGRMHSWMKDLQGDHTSQYGSWVLADQVARYAVLTGRSCMLAAPQEAPTDERPQEGVFGYGLYIFEDGEYDEELGYSSQLAADYADANPSIDTMGLHNPNPFDSRQLHLARLYRETFARTWEQLNPATEFEHIPNLYDKARMRAGRVAGAILMQAKTVGLQFFTGRQQREAPPTGPAEYNFYRERGDRISTEFRKLAAFHAETQGAQPHDITDARLLTDALSNVRNADTEAWGDPDYADVPPNAVRTTFALIAALRRDAEHVAAARGDRTQQHTDEEKTSRLPMAVYSALDGLVGEADTTAIAIELVRSDYTATMRELIGSNLKRLGDAGVIDQNRVDEALQRFATL